MLELLLVDGNRSGPVLLIPQLAPAGLDALARALLEAPSSGRRRLLPGPAQDAATPAVRAWHRDAWIALPAADRRAVAVAAGPGVASLAALIEGAEVAVTVREPLDAVCALVREDAPLPNRRALAALGADADRQPKPRMRQFSNPQARALLLAAVDGADLPVTLGPPPDADRWRELLFEDALVRARLIAEDGLPAAAGELAGELGYEPDARAQASELAGRFAGRRDRAPIDPDHVELIRELNWLDGELFVRCGRTGD